jgi:hypothetical protein
VFIGGFLASIIDQRDQSTHYHNISGGNVAINSQVGSQSFTPSPTHDVIELLNRISSQLAQDSELVEVRRQELLNDVRTLRSELERATPRQGFIRDILSTFGDVSSIASLIITLRQYLGV